MKKRELFPKPLLDEGLLIEAFEKEGINAKHAQFIWRQVIQHGVTDVTTLPSVPKKAFEVIKREFVLSTSKVVSEKQAKDGSTTKLLIELQDGQQIETVIMRYGDVALSSYPEDEKEKRTTEDGQFMFKSKKRATVCVSSQVGCAMGCTFCATGTMNLLSNLTAGEILEQLYHANQVEKIRNVVFMGMGEPLDNYNAVLMAVKAMIDTSRFGLSPARVTISTVGVVPRLLALSKDLPQIGLALSLHAPTQELRQQIVPTSKAWHIDRILEATDAFIAQQNANVKSKNRRRHILIEYVLIRDVNDSDEVAHDLGKLLQGKDVLLNVIPYNPTDVPYDYKAPTAERGASFVDITRRIYGLHTLFRQELGQDIASACGQLVIDSKKTACNEPIADMEDIGAKKKSSPSIKIRSKSSKKPAQLQITEEMVKYGLMMLTALAAARLVWKFTR
jgi:sorting nexin-8